MTEESTPGGRARVQELCRQLIQLVSRSRQQRGAIERLLVELNALARRVERRARVADASDDREDAASPLTNPGPR